MPEIAFLLGDPSRARNDNHARLPGAFRGAGWRVHEVDHEQVRLACGAVQLGPHPADRFDLIWPLGFGAHGSFFDRMQLLRLLPPERLVTAVDALVFLHGKFFELARCPETHAGADLEALAAVVRSGGHWVVKPSAGSYGRGVSLVRAGDDPLPSLIDATAGGGYAIVQRFVPEVLDGEKRTLVAGGRPIGTYRRVPGTDLRANLQAGGNPAPAELDDAEHRLVGEVSHALTAAGVGFAAIDTVYPWLMEVNVANPGGLETMEKLYGVDHAPAVAAAIIARWRARVA